MKERWFPRLVGLFGLYILVLAVLVVAQFTRRTAFTLTVASMAVSGNYRDLGLPKNAAPGGEQALSGDTSVFFGGMEFSLTEKQGLAPETMTSGEGLLRFRLADGSSLEFRTLFSGGSELLQIQASLGPKSAQLKLPFRPLRSSRIEAAGKNSFILAAADQRYTFTRARLNLEDRTILLNAAGNSAFYGAVPAKKAFSPGEYALAEAADAPTYEQELTRRRRTAFGRWERAMAENPGEEIVVAYVAESGRAGNYRSAVATTPAAFLNGPRRGYPSAVYFGGLDAALRSLSAAEREHLGRLSRLANERSPDLIAEPHVVAFLAVRGSNALIGDIVGLLKALDPAALTTAAAAGILEGWSDWRQYRGAEANPFDALVDQARFIVSGAIRKTEQGDPYVDSGSPGDPVLSLRVGAALAVYAAAAKLTDWEVLGRSLVLSALKAAEQDAAVSAGLFLLLQAGAYAPRAVALAAETGTSLWAWTGAVAATARQAEGMLDIAVDFPVGETHYLLVRGIKPFARLQLYDIDFRTDPRFERYDSSGWAYSASEQTLLVKMKHRSPTEHIRIYF